MVFAKHPEEPIGALALSKPLKKVEEAAPTPETLSESFAKYLEKAPEHDLPKSLQHAPKEEKAFKVVTSKLAMSAMPAPNAAVKE